MPYEKDPFGESFDELYEERKKINDRLKVEEVEKKLEAAGFNVEALEQRFEKFLSPPAPPMANKNSWRWWVLNAPIPRTPILLAVCMLLVGLLFDRLVMFGPKAMVAHLGW